MVINIRHHLMILCPAPTKQAGFFSFAHYIAAPVAVVDHIPGVGKMVFYAVSGKKS